MAALPNGPRPARSRPCRVELLEGEAMRKCLVLSSLALALVLSGAAVATAQEVISFDTLPSGFYSGTEGDPGTLEVFGSGGSGTCSSRSETNRLSARMATGWSASPRLQACSHGA